MSPKVRTWGIVGLCVALAAIGFGAKSKIQDLREQRDLETEIDLARKAGLPVTAEEFEATIPSVRQGDNAGPIIGVLGNHGVPMVKDASILSYKLTFQPDDNTKEAVRNELNKQSYYVKLGEDACLKLSYQPLRDYTLGAALLLPDASQIKNLAWLFLLRARLQDADGHPERALADIARARRLGSFASDDCMQITRLVGGSVENSARQTLAELSLHRRDVAAYREALGRIVEAAKPQDIRDDFRYQLVEVLSMIRLCETSEGRKELGLTEEEASIPLAGRALASMQSPLVGKTKVVRGVRKMWEALQKGDEGAYAAGSDEMWQGMLAFPVAAKIVEKLGDSSAEDTGILGLAKHRLAMSLVWKAAARALSGNAISKSISTADLVSPIDQKPVQYRWDGAQITISAGFGLSIQIPKVPKTPTTAGVLTPSGD